MSEITPNFTELLNAAQKVVEDKYLYKKFIEGKPLQNDVPVWMAEFARAWMAEIYGYYLEKCDECDRIAGSIMNSQLEFQVMVNRLDRSQQENQRLQQKVDGVDALQQSYSDVCRMDAEANLRIVELQSIIDKQRSDLQDVINIQSSNGNFDCNQYMHGMANGLICALSILTGDEPKYLEAPDKWLDDLQNIPAATCEENLQVSGETLALTHQQTNDGDVK